MDEKNPFFDSIQLLKSINAINTIFDVDSINHIDGKMFESYKRHEPLFFIRNNLPNLIFDCSLITSRDYYEDEEFGKLNDSLNRLWKNEYENAFGAQKMQILIDKFPFEATKLYVLLLMFLCAGYMELKPKTPKNLQSFEEDFQKAFGFNKKTQLFNYRGVTNIEEHDLFPSMFRSIKDCHVHINDKYIDKLYEVNNYRAQYEKIFGLYNRGDFYAYMQHSVSFSR